MLYACDTYTDHLIEGKYAQNSIKYSKITDV